MSAPKRPEYGPPSWRPDRLRLACKVRGIDINSPTELRNLINAYRATVEWRGGIGREPVGRITVVDWLSGKTDPSAGRTGFPSAVFELAHVLQVSVDWLMNRTSRWSPFFTRSERYLFTGDEGWS
jgi:hypothetical protein